MNITNDIIQKYGSAGAIPEVEVKCLADEFENVIRRNGVLFCCEWFGHAKDSDFTKETIITLLERSGIYIK